MTWIPLSKRQRIRITSDRMQEPEAGSLPVRRALRPEMQEPLLPRAVLRAEASLSVE